MSRRSVAAPWPLPTGAGFKFLYVGKWEKRKNTDFLIQAFADEFKPDEKVELWLQWFNPFVQFDPYERVFQLNLPRHANIVFLQQLAICIMRF